LSNLGGQAALGYTPLKPANNLSDVASPATALANLGGQKALTYTPLNPANNLSDVASIATALANLGVQAALTYTPLKPANNLNDVASPATALANLGVGLCSLKNYNATGNGTTDDTVAIQSAITACSSFYSGGFGPTLYVPTGTYKISATLRIPGYLNIKGEGYEASAIKQTCGTCNLFTAAQNGAWLGASYFGGGVSDITLEGNGHLTTGTLLEIQNTGGYVVNNVVFYNHGGRGLTAGEGSERSKFTNLLFELVRWPETFIGYEFHNVGLNINQPGGTADTTAPPGYSPTQSYCYSVNCINGVYPEPGGQTVVSTSGSGTVQSYVLSGTSPVVAGHSAYFSGCSVTGYNGYYAVTGATNNTPTTGEFTLTVAGSATGSTTGCAFQAALRPDNQHAAVWVGMGAQVSFEDGEIKPLVFVPAFKFASGNSTRVDQFYLEGYTNPVNSSILVGGLPDQMIGNGTLTTNTVGGTVGGINYHNTSTTYPVIPVTDTSWWASHVTDPNDIPAVGIQGNYGIFAKILCPDYNPNSSSACAGGNSGVLQNEFEIAVVMTASDGNVYLISRNQSGSTAPANTVWVNPVIDYYSQDSITGAGGLLLRQNTYLGDLPANLSTGYVQWCADGTVNQCAEIEAGAIPDGYGVHFGSSSTDNSLTGVGAAHITFLDGPEFGVMGEVAQPEVTGSGWIKAAIDAEVTIIGGIPGTGASETGEIGQLNSANSALILSNPQIAAAQYNSVTASISIASPAVITVANTLSAGNKVQFATTGALPTGLSTGTTYYVISAGLSTSQFEVSATSGGPAINTSGSQSGTQTALMGPLASLQVFNGDGLMFTDTFVSGAANSAFGQAIPFVNDSNLGGQPGFGNGSFGYQFGTSYCYYDTGTGTSGSTAHALSRFCYKGGPGLSGTSTGWEYDTWNGTAWVNAFSITPNSGGTSGTVGGYIGSTLAVSSGSQALWRLGAAVINTGSTAQKYVACTTYLPCNSGGVTSTSGTAMSIPPNTVGANNEIDFDFGFLNPSANTGTCTYALTLGGNYIGQQTATAAGHIEAISTRCMTNNSTSTISCVPYVGSAPVAAATPFTLNMAGSATFSIGITNSVSGDTCEMVQGLVTLN
jgi:hypothetical protein